MNMASYREINHCRVATNSSNLVPVLSLGHQALTGVFPKSADESVTVGPLELVWCPDSGLLQLKHTYESSERSEEHTSELQSLMRISYAVFCLKKQTTHPPHTHNPPT